MNSRIWERKIEKHKIQKIGCDRELKADENWMSTEISLVRGIVRGQFFSVLPCFGGLTRCALALDSCLTVRIPVQPHNLV